MPFLLFLHVVDPGKETPGNKLHNVEEFIASFKERRKLLYQCQIQIISNGDLIDKLYRTQLNARQRLETFLPATKHLSSPYLFF